MNLSIYSHDDSDLYPYHNYGKRGSMAPEVKRMQRIFNWPSEFVQSSFEQLCTYFENISDKPAFTSAFQDNVAPSSTIVNLDGVNILSPFVTNYLGEHSSGKKIYSFLPKAFYEIFDDFIVFDKDVFNLPQNVRIANNFLSKKHLKDLKTIDFDYGASGKHHLISYKANIHAALCTLLINNNLEIPSFDNIKILDTKGTCSGSTFEFSLKTVSHNKIMKHSGGFVPVLVPFSFMHVRSSIPVKDAYLFTFMYNIDYVKVNKYKKASLYLKKFLENAFVAGGSYFYNQDLYTYYCAKKFESYGGLTEVQYNNAVRTKTLSDLSKYKKYTYISKPASLFKDFTLPQDFTAKKNKFVAKQKQVKTYLEKDFNDNLHTFRFFRRDYNYALNDLERYQSMVDNLQRKITEKKQELLEIKNKAASVFDDYSLNFKLSSKLKEKMQQIKQEEAKIVESLEPEIDPYFTNIFDSIELHSIEVLDTNGNSTIFNSESNIDITTTSFTKRFLADKTINKIVFATKGPSKIKVVQSNDAVVGGPYIIKVTKGGLSLALKSLKSYYATASDRRTLIHPHCSSINLTANSGAPHYSSACLGEASSLIYKAFEDKDIKLIITSALLWVCSANAIDVWGKNYKYFTPWEEYERQTKIAEAPFILNEDLEKSIPGVVDSYTAFTDSLPSEEELQQIKATKEDVPTTESEPVTSQEPEPQAIYLEKPDLPTLYTPLINLG